MIVPGRDLWEKLLTSAGGLWSLRLDDGLPVLVAKLNRATIKFVLGGSRVEIVTATQSSAAGPVRLLGLRVFDDPEHPVAFFGVVPSEVELATLDAILGSGRARMEFFDEACAPTLAASAQFETTSLAVKAVSLPTVDAVLNGEILDQFEAVLEGRPGTGLLEHKVVRLTLDELKPLNVALIGGEYKLGSGSEGAELERAVEMLLDGLLPLPSLRGPRIATKLNRPELCDVLGFGPEFAYALVVQAKVDGVLAAGPGRTPSRRLATIRKNLNAAVRQGRGAARALARGVRIEHELLEGPILARSIGRIHVVVVLSEMHAGLAWEEIASLLLAESSQGTLFHVLDATELQRLISACQMTGEDTAAQSLDAMLGHRWSLMQEHGTACIRLRFQ
jgi:hypothetical protein